MGAASLAERARLGRLMAVNAWHAFHRRLTYYSVSWDALSVFDRAELTLVPQDIRTADPTIAEDIYSGRFAFTGEVIEERTESPFGIIPPSTAWAEELHSFSWLRHLRASEKAIAQVNAQALVLDWIESTKLDNVYAWVPMVLATRILAWISQSPLILADCDRVFYQKFARSLSRQVRYLRKSINNAPDGLPRMKAAIALTAASVAISNQSRFRRQSLRRLDQELQRQILPDGGHFSRNPLPIVEILLDLLPLRQAILATQLVPSQTLMNSIDRMIPMIRFFQLGDGAFARFNGTGVTPVDLLAAILAHDDTRGLPPFNASPSGYQRLQSGDTILIMDTGAPPPTAVSNKAHAGCLSFEMSAGNRPIIINCGIPPESNGTMRRLARTTPAHSTLTIANRSSCRFAALTRYTATHGVPILSGPSSPDVTREDAGGTTFLSTRHDGYKRETGFLHERSLTLHDGGLLIEGIDSLIAANPKQTEQGSDYVIRFHLHPFVKPGPIEAGGIVRLSLRGGQIWRFAAPGSEIEIEESVYLSEIVGSLPTQQIVVYGKSAARQTVSWRLERMQDMELLSGFDDLELDELIGDLAAEETPDTSEDDFSAPPHEDAAEPDITSDGDPDPTRDSVLDDDPPPDSGQEAKVEPVAGETLEADRSAEQTDENAVPVATADKEDGPKVATPSNTGTGPDSDKNGAPEISISSDNDAEPKSDVATSQQAGEIVRPPNERHEPETDDRREPTFGDEPTIPDRSDKDGDTNRSTEPKI